MSANHRNNGNDGSQLGLGDVFAFQKAQEEIVASGTPCTAMIIEILDSQHTTGLCCARSNILGWDGIPGDMKIRKLGRVGPVSSLIRALKGNDKNFDRTLLMYEDHRWEEDQFVRVKDCLHMGPRDTNLYEAATNNRGLVKILVDLVAKGTSSTFKRYSNF